jgi:hypothetical protein
MLIYEEKVKIATDALEEGDVDKARHVTASLLESSDPASVEVGMNLTEITGGQEGFG